METRRYKLNAPTVIAEIIDGEVMVMNLTLGVYYSVTGAGALAWPALVSGAGLADTARAVAQSGGADIARVAADLAVFVDQLAAEDILHPVTDDSLQPDDSAALALAGLAPHPYAGFGFERFDDMRAMLVIDPVHEVGDFGWPQAAGSRERG